MVVHLEMLLIWYKMQLNQDGHNHQVIFKRIGNYATDVHFHHIQIPVNLSKVIDTPTKAMETIKSYVTNVYQNSMMYYRDDHRTKPVDKHQAHLAANLIRDSCEFVINT